MDFRKDIDVEGRRMDIMGLKRIFKDELIKKNIALPIFDMDGNLLE